MGIKFAPGFHRVRFLKAKWQRQRYRYTQICGYADTQIQIQMADTEAKGLRLGEASGQVAKDKLASSSSPSASEQTLEKKGKAYSRIIIKNV